MKVSKTSYLKEKFSTSNIKQLLKLVHGMFSVKSSANLPTHDSLEHLADSFGDFFESKIIDIRRALSSQQPCSRSECLTNVSSVVYFFQSLW